MIARMRFLGIDIGSSFIKGAVLDTDELTIENITRQPFPEPIAGLPASHFEVDPQAVMHATRRVVDDLFSFAPDCRGLLFAAQMGGVILTDARGRPATNYLSWRDQRTTLAGAELTREDVSSLARRASVDEVAALLGEETLGELGQELRPGSATSLLYWLGERGKLPEAATPLSLGDFVAAQLGGGSPRTQYTQALGTLNLTTRDWHRGALQKLGLDRLAWPLLAEVWQPIGEYQAAGRLIPCFPAVGDHQCALAGAQLESGELSINVSTGSQVSLLTESLTLGEYQSRPYLDERWLNTITHLPAGRSLDVLVRLLTELPTAEGIELDPWPAITRAAAAANDEELAVDLAFFAGPLGSRGSVTNISVENLTIGNLFRAALRGMAANYARCAARLSSPQTWRRIVFSGGLAQKLELLRQFILAELAGDWRLCSHPEDTLQGMLTMALVIAGRAENLASASRLLATAQN